MSLQEREFTKDDRLALAIGRYVLGDLTLEEAADFANVDQHSLILPLRSGHVESALEAAESVQHSHTTDMSIVEAPPGTATGEASPLERYRSIKKGAQEYVEEEDIGESVVKDAIEWARTG